MGFRQFGPHILALEKKTNAVQAHKMMRIPQKLRQGRTGPGGNDIKYGSGRIFHSAVGNGHAKFHGGGSGGKKGTFLGRGFVERDLDPVPQQFRQDQARKSGAGTQIGQAPGAFRNQWRQLGGIPEVPPPDIVQRLGRNQIVPRVPIQQKARIALEAAQCFT